VKNRPKGGGGLKHKAHRAAGRRVVKDWRLWYAKKNWRLGGKPWEQISKENKVGQQLDKTGVVKESVFYE